MKLNKQQKQAVETQALYDIGRVRFNAGQLAAEIYEGTEEGYDGFMEDVEKYYRAYLRTELSK